MKKYFILFLFLIARVGYSLPPSPVWPKGTRVETYQKGLLFKTTLSVDTENVSPKASARSASKGSLLTGDQGLFWKNDAGSSTNWLKLLSESDLLGDVTMGGIILGDGTAVTRRITVNRGGSNPFLKWDEATTSWVFSNNGSIEKKLGPGPSGEGGVNLLQNPSLEDAGSPVLNWSNTGGTFTQGVYTNGFEGDLKFGTFVSTTTAQFVQSDLITWPEFITDGGQYKIKYKNGNDAFKLQVLNSSAVLLGEAVLTNLANWQDLVANSFFAPVAGTQVRLRIVSTGAGTINFDKTYLGSNTNVGSTQLPSQILELETSDGAGSTDTKIRKFLNLTVNSGSSLFTHNHGSYGTKGLELVALRDIEVEGEYCDQPSGNKNFGFSVNSSMLTTDIGGLTYAQGKRGSSTTNDVSGIDNACVPFHLSLNSGDILRPHTGTGFNVTTSHAFFRIKATAKSFVPAQTTLQNDWFISANIGGASPILGTQSNFTAPSAATLDLVLNTGSAPAKITCDGAEIASGLTCTANEQFGLSFNNVLTGWHTICAVGGGRLDSSSSTTFAFVRTANNSQTALEVANEKVTTQTSTPNTAPFQLSNYCAEFNFSAIAEQTIRFMYEADGGGSGAIIADRNAALGSRDFHIKVMQGRFNQPRAILSGDQVTSKGANKPWMESGVFTNGSGLALGNYCSTANCLISQKVGTRVTNVDAQTGSGDFWITFDATVNTSKVTCVGATYVLGLYETCTMTHAPAGQVVKLTCYNGGNKQGNYMCMGQD